MSTVALLRLTTNLSFLKRYDATGQLFHWLNSDSFGSKNCKYLLTELIIKVFYCYGKALLIYLFIYFISQYQWVCSAIVTANSLIPDIHGFDRAIQMFVMVAFVLLLCVECAVVWVVECEAFINIYVIHIIYVHI